MSRVFLRKYGESAVIPITLFEVDGIDMRTDAIAAAGDVKITKDEGAEANTTNNFSDEGSIYSLTLTATELQAARVSGIVIDQTATKAWLDTDFVIETYGNASAQHAFDLDTASVAQSADNDTILAGLNNFDPAADTVANVDTVATNTDMVAEAPTVGAIADAVLDEVNTTGTHNVVNSLGRQIRGLEIGNILHAASTQSGSSTDIINLANSASTLDDFYQDQLLIIDGEARIILAYVGSTRSATLHRALVGGAPSNNTDYEILTLGPAFATALGGSYFGLSIHLALSGSLTAIVDRDGLDTNPIDDGQLANARIVADLKQLDSFILGNGATVVLDTTYENWGFSGPGSSVDTNGQSISGSRFTGLTVSGTSLDTSISAVLYTTCRILSHTVAGFSGFNNCDLVGPITMSGASTYRFKDCAPITASGCTFDFSAAGSQMLLLLNWNDGATIQNLGNTGTDSIIITGSGHITLEASCIGGTITWSGDIKFTNNGSGITFIQGLIGDIVEDTSELQGLIAALPTAAEVNAEMVDVMETDTHAEPTLAMPATSSYRDAIMGVKTQLRNKMTQTATTTLLRDDTDSGTISTSTVSDDGTTFIKGKHI